MSLFSKLFHFAANDTELTPSDEIFEELKLRFDETATFYTKAVIFNQKEKKSVRYIMIHPSAGLVLFNYFNYSALELENVTATLAKGKTSKADIRTMDDKGFIQQRFEEMFNTQIAPVRSVLICPNLSEGEFDYLDESFHQYIPKTLALFNDSTQQHYEAVVLGEKRESYDTDKIKQALFGEFIVPEKNTLMSDEQQDAVHKEIKHALNIKALPGSGKSSLLVAKAMHAKMNNPQMEMIIFGKLPCNVHHLQSLIFHFSENSHWGLNPADITVSSFESIKKRLHSKEKYDLIVCDDINPADLKSLKQLLNKKGRLLLSSSYDIDDVESVSLVENYRLTPAMCAACEGLEVENLSNSLILKSGNTFMNTILILEQLLPETAAQNITIVHHDKEELLQLQNEIDSFFTPLTSLFDDPNAKQGIMLYPLSHLSCVVNDYVIVIIDETPQESLIQLISRARKKSFVLSADESVHQLINHIKGENNETD